MYSVTRDVNFFMNKQWNCAQIRPLAAFKNFQLGQKGLKLSWQKLCSLCLHCLKIVSRQNCKIVLKICVL